jgi:hypothetical protein
VFTRNLERKTNTTIEGEVLLYVDDFCGCSPVLSAESDRSKTRELTVQFMGTDLVAENKWEFGRSIDFVGWQFNLNSRRVTLSKKNHYKAIYYFFIVDTEKPQSLQTSQQSYEVFYGVQAYAAIHSGVLQNDDIIHFHVSAQDDDTNSSYGRSNVESFFVFAGV